MKARPYLFITILFILLASILFITIKLLSRDQTDRLVVEGIESFSYDRTEGENRYLLFYPADWRVSQSFTLVREVTSDGEIVDEYEIHDEDFRRMSIHQKPTDMNTLYLSMYGEATIDNWFYTFDIEKGSFKKMPIHYFTHEAGVNHIKHYGKDVLFNTVVSHVTGDQDLDPLTGQFKMSFSNFTTEESFETDLGREPSSRPVLQFNGKLIYSGDGSTAELDEGYLDQRFVAFVDEETGVRKYTNFGFDPYVSFAPIYANQDYAYILAETGELIVLDGNFKEQIFRPFKEFASANNNYSFEDRDNYLMIDEERALFIVYDFETDLNTFGILAFGEEPSFNLLEKDYINRSSYYRLLYQDPVQGIIYVLERNEGFPDEDGMLLIIDSDTFDLVDEVPVKYQYLLDMVIRR